MLHSAAFYTDPLPGFIVTGAVCGAAFLYLGFIAARNFGPWERLWSRDRRTAKVMSTTAGG